MKVIGAILMAVGLLWLVVAINMETTVVAGGDRIRGGMYGNGESAMYVPEERTPFVEVSNLHKMEQRRTHLTLAAITLISGVAFFGFGTLNGSSLSLSAPKDRKCPACAELVKAEATVCRFCSAKLDPIKTPESARKAQYVRTSQAIAPVPQTAEPPSYAICETCRATNDGEAKTCSRCGAALATET